MRLKTNYLSSDERLAGEQSTMISVQSSHTSLTLTLEPPSNIHRKPLFQLHHPDLQRWHLSTGPPSIQRGDSSKRDVFSWSTHRSDCPQGPHFRRKEGEWTIFLRLSNNYHFPVDIWLSLSSHDGWSLWKGEEVSSPWHVTDERQLGNALAISYSTL